LRGKKGNNNEKDKHFPAFSQNEYEDPVCDHRDNVYLFAVDTVYVFFMEGKQQIDGGPDIQW
jgi:hypothetical protein